MRSFPSAVVLFVTLAAGSAAAQSVSLPSSGSPVRPRVFVIFDSSTSMMQDPAYRVNFNLWSGDDTRSDPDTQFVDSTNCRSKFCIAKDVVYNVLKTHAEEVRIGVASYYQYIARYEPVDNRQTKCWYDAMYKPGTTLFYPRTGTTATRLGGVTAVGDTATGIELGGLSDGHHASCYSGHTYNLTASMVNPAGTQNCTVYNQRTNPGTFTASATVMGSCQNGQTYTVSSGPTPAPASCSSGGACFVRRQAASTACPTAVDPMSITGSTPSMVVTPSMNQTAWEPGFNPAQCVGAGCNMFSAGAGDALPLLQSWYGLFDGACATAPGAGDGLGFNCINPSSMWPTMGRQFRHPTRVDSVVVPFTGVLTGQSSCVGTQGVRTRYNTGLRSRFMTTTNYNAATGLLPLPATFGNATPTSSCTADWPCDTTLVSDTAETPGPPTLSPIGTCPAPASLGPGETCDPNGVFGVNRLRVAFGAMCPSLTGTYSSNPPGGNWSPSPGCGSGNNQCQFQVATPPSSTGTSGVCAATVFRWDGNSQLPCSDVGQTFTYSSGAQAPFQVHREIPATSSCPANGSNADTAPVYGSALEWGGNTAELTNCRAAPGACTLLNLNETISPNVQTQWSSSTTPPTQFTQGSGERRGSGSVTRELPSCSSYSTGSTFDLGGQWVRFVGDSPGPTVAEVQMRICRFDVWERSYTRPLKRCNYEIERRTFTTENRFTNCNYERLRFQLSTPPPPTRRCEYSNVIRRFDFTFPDQQQCKYYRLETQGRRDLFTYSYSYQTRGGEFAGAWSATVPGDVTNTSVPYSDFSATCPPVRDECLGPNTTCYLRNGNDTSNFTWTNNRNQPNINTSPASAGRFVNTGATPVDFSTTSNFPDRTGPNAGRGGIGVSCIARDFTTEPTTEPARARYTRTNGAAAPGAPRFQLVSDYFSCTNPNDPNTCEANNISAINSDARTAPGTLNPATLTGGPYRALTTADWTATARKSYGFSGVGPMYSTPSQMFMPFPDDADPTGNLGQLKQMMSRCEKPAAGNVNPTTLAWNSRGVCMADVGAPNAEGMGDFTPLYGSLQNVRQYIQNTLATDTTYTGETTCRKVFVILATDGAENTPSNYSNERTGTVDPTQLQSAVASLRAVRDPVTNRRLDVKTYVVGFGDATADPAAAGLLNAMANSGGTIGAYFASDRAGLVTELNRVLAGALEGTYSRSKPVISTDGRSIFASTFDRDGTTPEWRGNFVAYGISTVDGTLSERWNLAPKLNGMSDGDRRLYTDIPGETARANFTTGNSDLNDRLTAHPDFPDDGPGGSADLDPDRLIRFVRNATRNEQFFSSPARRQSRLNAVIHSSPVVIGRSVLPPWWGGPEGSAARASYATFQAAIQGRQERVLVGASDGILRAARDNTGNAADDGLEAWGWVPSPIHRQLYRSMLGGYNGMDGQIGVADICSNTNDSDGDAKLCAASDWRTVAIAATGRGGRGMMALDVTNPNDPRRMWRFNNTSDFGYAWSAPVIGRVEIDGRDQYLAIFGGGVRNQGVDGPLSDEHGDEVYMLNAMTGEEEAFFDATGDMQVDDIFGEDNQFAARPSFWQRPASPYMDHAVYAGTNGRIYMSRFRGRVSISGSGIEVPARDNDNDWQPETWFDPTAPQNRRNPNNQDVTVRRVKANLTDPANPVYTQVTADPGAVRDDVARTPEPWTGEQLPLSRSLPIWVRPRSTAVTNSARLLPDYFVGTGDGLNPGEPRPEYRWNYFYALHDSNRRNDGRHDAAPLWVNQFTHEREQVVSEPALVQGALVVATYLPPTTTSPCENAGDTLLYCFNPVSGDLTRCLVNADGTTTSVLRLPGVGIPSDLVTVNDNLYFTASNVAGPPLRQVVRPTLETGDVRSWRRVR